MKEEHPLHLLQGSRSLYLLLQSLNSFKFCRDRNISNEHKEEEMKKIIMSAVALTAIIGPVSTLSAADGINILNDMKVTGEIRPRYEHVEVKDSANSAANAFTARVRLAVETKSLAEISGLTAKVGVTSVNNFGYTKYNDKAGQGTGYEVILDPQQAMLSEAYLSYTAADTTLLAGRSHVNLDDQRFIGTVGWRQMERAYDTVTVVNKSVEGLTLLGSYVYGYAGVNSVTTVDTASVLLNVNYKLNDALVVSGFDYMLANIHDTYGLRVSGKKAVSDSVKLNYALSYAMQTDNSLQYGSGDVTNSIDASYYDAVLGANMNGFILGGEYEVLGKAANATDTDGFTTPLATLHKFQGFADVFLGRTKFNGLGGNKDGLIDMSIKAGYKTKGFGKALVWYHKFDAETGNDTDLGSEVDAVYANAIPGFKNLKGLVKAAYYIQGDATTSPSNDKAVVWAQLDYKF